MTWRTVPLKRVASIRVSNVDKKSVDDEASVRLCNYTDVYYRNVINSAQQFMQATASPEQVTSFRLITDDVIITKDSEAADDIGVPTYVEESAPDLVCGYHLALIRPLRQLVDGRFLFWAMASSSMRNQLEIAATGITRFGLRADAIGGATIDLPSLLSQRAIANFLDAETARIDTLIVKKRRQQAVLLEHEEAVLLDQLGDWRSIPDRTLRQYGALAVTGPFGTQLAASEYVSGGVPVINPTHIERGRLKPENEVTVPAHVAARLKRHQLLAGDIVLGRKGDVGRSAIVTSREAGWICGSDSIAVRTNRTRLHPEFLVRLLSIDLYRQQLQATSTGTTMANVNQSTLLRLRMPALSLREQHDRLASAEHATAPHEALATTLDRQITLLTEHRQALITAAVTGEIGVPGARGS